MIIVNLYYARLKKKSELRADWEKMMVFTKCKTLYRIDIE